jgi:uncharacterized OB-fold protein
VAKKAIKDDLFTEPLEPVDQVRLAGSRCRDCSEVFLGRPGGCENCGSVDLEPIALSNEGTLYTYTILHAPPRGDYKGPRDPFIPLGIGLVELPEGCRVMAPLTANDPQRLKIDMTMRLVVDTLYTDADGNEVLAFKFDPK